MSSVDVSIIVPTYREAANLPLLVPRIAVALEQAGLRGEILIVDDNSPDDTPAVCAELAQQYPVRLETRLTERGLSSAVLHGMRLATGDVLLVMDADLSHPPEKIPELVAALGEAETDFVIGSRYVTGAATDEDWGLFRKLNSRGATWLARPLTKAADPMAGFFALRRMTFEAAAPLDPIGYKIGLELIVKCHCRNIREVPIVFADRVHGESKLSLKEQLNYLRHLTRLYKHNYPFVATFTQFALVGLTGMAVDLACLTELLRWLPFSAARGLSIWMAMTWNFLLNRRFTFAASRGDSPFWQYPLFCIGCLAGAFVNWTVSLALMTGMPVFADQPIAASLVGIVAGTAINFVLSKHVAFRKRVPSGVSHGPAV